MRLTQSLFIRVVVAALAAIAVILAATALDLRRAYQEAAVRRLLVTLAELRINVEGRIEPGRVAAALGNVNPLCLVSRVGSPPSALIRYNCGSRVGFAT